MFGAYNRVVRRVWRRPGKFRWPPWRSVSDAPKPPSWSFAGGHTSSVWTKKKYNLLSPEQTISGFVSSVIFRNDNTMYSVLACTQCTSKPFAPGISGDHSELTSLVVRGTGPILIDLQPGDRISVSGCWEDDRVHGKQFSAVCNAPMPVEDLPLKTLTSYLGAGAIRQIGKSRAKKIVENLGEETRELFGKSPRSMEKKLLSIPGFGKMTVETILKGITMNLAQRAVLLELINQGFTNTQARTLNRMYGSSALGIMTGNPYLLAEEVPDFGFATADDIALRQGMALDAEFRLESGILHVLSKASMDGHCCLSRGELISKTLDLINAKYYNRERARMRKGALEGKDEKPIPLVEPVTVNALVTKMVKTGSLLVLDIQGNGNTQTEMIYHPKVYNVEKKLARHIVSRVASNAAASSLTYEPSNSSEGALSAEQVRALKMAQDDSSKFLVVTGGPGTGKTYVMREIVKAWEKMGMRIALASPTARAAQRLLEAVGDPKYDEHAKTIHRLLEYTSRINSFKRHGNNPLEYDAIVVDEASMLDIYLAQSLMDAIPKHARVLFVGDADQLPSVGAGNVLRDIIGSSTVPVVELQTIFRQDQASAIVKDAHLVNAGSVPRNMKHLVRLGDTFSIAVSEQHAPYEDGDVLFLNVEDPAEAVDLLDSSVLPYLTSLGFDIASDVQVLAPMKAGHCGTVNICNRTQATINPNFVKFGPNADTPGSLVVGDRVMQDANDYNIEVYNGEIGRIVERYKCKGKGKRRDYEAYGYVVDIGGREVRYEGTSIRRLQLAYACTVHKSQGSEFPAVILPLVSEHAFNLSKNLLYTGLTRASRLAVIVGSWRMLHAAVKKVDVKLRQTGLRHQILELSVNRGGECSRRQHQENTPLWDTLGLEELFEEEH